MRSLFLWGLNKLMPRQARLDAPGLLQHVMARGIEIRAIFRDDKDCKSFLDRLADILEETQTQCYVYPVECLSLFHWGLGFNPKSRPTRLNERLVITGLREL